MPQELFSNMTEKNCSDLSNSEIKEYILTLENEFEAIKAKIKVLCGELEAIESAYDKAQNEIKMRKTVF